ncbi:MAG: type II toxin-antitoxin system VapC family toxin, partial [Candidatus Poribacteria bacterium]|nr:type II toxin-antitoxin system VapC family toxin [Candidatus Poribacteria bacterium]
TYDPLMITHFLIHLINISILIDAMHGIVDAVTFLAEQQVTETQISIVSAMELIAGCRNKTEMRELQEFFQRCTFLPVTTTISQVAFQLMESFYLSHGLVLSDALIAATAIEHDLTLYTRNTRHFRMIPQLKISQPY